MTTILLASAVAAATTPLRLQAHAQRYGASMSTQGMNVPSVTAAIAYVTSLEYAGWTFDWAEVLADGLVLAAYDGDAWTQEGPA